MKHYLMLYLLFCVACTLVTMDGDDRRLKRIPYPSPLQPPPVDTTIIPRLLAIMRAAIKAKPIGKVPKHKPHLPVPELIRDLLTCYREKFKHKINLEVTRLCPEPLTKSVLLAPSKPSDQPMPPEQIRIIEELKTSVPRLKTVQFVTTISNSAGFASTNKISLNPSRLLQSRNSQQSVILHEAGHIEYNDSDEGWEMEKKLGKYGATNPDLANLMRTHEMSADAFALSKGPEVCQGFIEFADDTIARGTSDATTDTKTHPSMEKRKEIATIYLTMYQRGILR